MEELQELLEKMREQRPSDWASLPDIPLYMDQVLSLMSRQTISFEGDDALTGAMVNNYIKDGVMPRADGKRYNAEHLAYLTAICVLKQVLPVRDIALVRRFALDGDAQERYEGFRRELDRALDRAADELPPEFETEGNPSARDMADAALRFALLSYSYDLACRRIVAVLRDKYGDEPDKKHAKKPREEHKKA
jgi:hypothetical protein